MTALKIIIVASIMFWTHALVSRILFVRRMNKIEEFHKASEECMARYDMSEEDFSKEFWLSEAKRNCFLAKTLIDEEKRRLGMNK